MGLACASGIVEDSFTNSLSPSRATHPPPSRGPRVNCGTAFGSPRDFLDNRFVYLVISERARGLSVGVNMNPDKLCDFDCLYCEVDRRAPSLESHLDVEVMATELQRTLALIARDELRNVPRFSSLDPDLRHVRHVTLSGDGEPTLSPQFAEAIQSVAHVRALCHVPFFKLILLTNGSGLDRPEVQQGLKLLTRQDEIWAKLDGGTETYLKRINRMRTPLDHVLSNILNLARQRPVIIQSLFTAVGGEEPPNEEIEAYADRLKSLKKQGAQIPLVQIYSATRPTLHPECTHLPLKSLSKIAHTVRDLTGLPAEVF